MPVSLLPCLTPMLLIGVPLFFVAKGRRAFLAAVVGSASVLGLLILSVYAPAWALMAQGDDPAAMVELAHWTEAHCEELNAIIPWVCSPDVLGGYGLLEKAARRDYPPALWIVGVRLKHGSHVPMPTGWSGPSGNVFPQPERGQAMIDRAVALGYTPPTREERDYWAGYRGVGVTRAMFLPVVVWVGVIGICSLVGAGLGSTLVASTRADPAFAARVAAVVAVAIAYASVASFLLHRVVEEHYWPPGLQIPAFFVVASLGVEAAISRAFGTHRVALGGAVVGLATTLCVVGPGIPLVFWLFPSRADAASLVTFVSTLAGAFAAFRLGRTKPGSGRVEGI